MITILYFGRLSEITGTLSESLENLPIASTVSDLKRWADDRFDATGIFLEPTVRVAVNGEIVDDTAVISNAQEIAFMPPVGGG